LRHTVAELVTLDLRGRASRQVLGGCCGQDCGQHSAQATERTGTLERLPIGRGSE